MSHPAALTALIEDIRRTLESGYHSTAEKKCRKALSSFPDSADLHLLMAQARVSQGRWADALESYRCVLTTRPDHYLAQLGCGQMFMALDRHEEALPYLREAFRVSPNADIAYSICNIEIELGRIETGIDAVRHAVDVLPDDWKLHSFLLSRQIVLPNLPIEKMNADIKLFKQRHGKSRWDGWLPGNTPDSSRKLRIGYVSGYFAAWIPTGIPLQFRPILDNHDSSEFEIFAYRDSPHDVSLMGPLLDKALWRDIHGLDDAASCRLIREDRLDIVVFLLGNTSRDRTLLPTHRVAPVQVNMLAMFSSGVDHMDYWIADRHSVPQPPQAHAGSDPEYFSETILHLPHVFCFAPVEWAPEVGPLPAATAGQGVTFGCFSLADKLNPDCIRGMARVLHRIDGARLLLKTKAQTYGQPASRKWVLDQFAVEGIEPSRLSFLPPTEAIPDHLAQYNQVDIALDTFPYTGRLTIYDSLWMGVPIITLGGGDRFIHREGASVLQAAGLAELIAETPSDYVDKAAALASDLTKLAELRRNLRSRVQASALCDGAGYVRSLEQAYRKIWAERCRLWH